MDFTDLASQCFGRKGLVEQNCVRVEFRQWVSTVVACYPTNNDWNHVTIQVQRESDNWLLFQSITLNGVTSTINQYYAPGSVSGNWWGITVTYQMDGNHDQAAYSAYLDNFTSTYW